MTKRSLSRRHWMLGLGGWCSGAALLFANPKPSDLATFTLEETTADIRTRFGAPAASAVSGSELVTWVYHLDGDHHDPSHSLSFRKSDGRLVSVTRNFPAPVDLNNEFGAKAAMRVYYFPNREQRQWSAGVWTLEGGKLAIAMGIGKPGDATTQGLLIRRPAVRLLLPWLDKQLG